jgi:nitrite reductase/ring-hydroxylating ferredoxin subunit
VVSKIASTSEVPPGKMIGIESQGRKILLANLEGRYYAIGNVCTHEGCTLSEGDLTAEQVQCPCHGSIFNVKTGEVVQGPASKPEPAYEIEVEGDGIFMK